MITRDWETIEARFQGAKQALREAQEQHCEAALEFLQARAALRQRLEAFFPEPNGCNRAVDTLTRCNSCNSGEVYSGDTLSPLTAH